MPTNKPRLTITLTENTYEIISQLAELQNRPKSSVIAELLESVALPLSKTVSLLQAASEAPSSVRNGLKQTVNDLHDDLSDVLGTGQIRLDQIIGDMGGNPR